MIELLPLGSATYCRVPPPVRFRDIEKSLIIRKRRGLDEEYQQDTDSKPGSAYYLVVLLTLGGATCYQFPLQVCSRNVNLETIRKQ
jgi:hypothetical protein